MISNVSGAFGNWSQVVIAGGVIMAGAGIAYRWINKRIVLPLKEVPDIRATQLATSIDVATLTTDVALIKAEHNPNGGSSTRDAIDRSERIALNTSLKLVELTDAFAIHVAEDSSQWERISSALEGLDEGQAAAAQTAVEVAHTAVVTAQALHDERS